MKALRLLAAAAGLLASAPTTYSTAQDYPWKQPRRGSSGKPGLSLTKARAKAKARRKAQQKARRLK